MIFLGNELTYRKLVKYMTPFEKQEATIARYSADIESNLNFMKENGIRLSQKAKDDIDTLEEAYYAIAVKGNKYLSLAAKADFISRTDTVIKVFLRLL